jgi:4-carboxymuconolactone decarboxylase
MKTRVIARATAMACGLVLAAPSIAAEPPPPARTGGASGSQQPRLAPGMARFTDEVLFGDVWLRKELSPRDRSLVVISALIASGKTAQLQGHLGRALDNGVTPREASGLLTHLAIYAGWPSAVSALDVYEAVYKARNVDTDALQSAIAPLPAPASDGGRAKVAVEQYGKVAPKFTELTNEVVFDDLWRQADLSVRDRSLVTIAALSAMGDDDLLEHYLRRGIEAGLNRDQIAEALTHLAFYAGFAKATKAMNVVTRTLGAGNAR